MSHREEIKRLVSIDQKLTPTLTDDQKQSIPVLLYGWNTARTQIVPVAVLPWFGSGAGVLEVVMPTWNSSAAAIGRYNTYTSISALANTSGLTHIHGKYNRNRVSIWIRCGGACNANLYVSTNSTGPWRRLLDNQGNPVTISLAAAGEAMLHLDYVAYPFLKVEVLETGIDIEIEVVSSSP